MRMPTGVTQSLLQGTATELDTTDNVRHSQVNTQENVQSTETWKRDRVISFNVSFRQRTAKSMSAKDVKTEFLNMEITHHHLCLERTRIICDWGLQDQDPYLLRWRKQFILDRQMRRIWRSSSTGTSRMLRIRSPSLKTWWWEILRKYWMWVRMTADHRDQVKKSKGTRLLDLSIMSWQNDLFKRWDQWKMDHRSGTIQDVPRRSRVLWLRWRSYWIRVGNFPEQRYRSNKYDVRTLNQNDSLKGSYSCQCSVQRTA